MARVKNSQELLNLRDALRAARRDRARSAVRVFVGMGTCGIAAGAREVLDALRRELDAHRVTAEIVPVGCIGACQMEPLVDIQINGGIRVTYRNVRPDMAPRLVQEHIIAGRVVSEWALARLAWDETDPLAQGQPDGLDALPQYADLPFYAKQQRVAMRNCGLIDPGCIEDYLARDGYLALARAVSTMRPADLVDEVTKSGLRGRGGGGFKAGVKWALAAKQVSDIKYVVCNADEGDPGAFMDRSILEGDPHAVIEGMALCGYATGASTGIVYCRAEYPLAIQRLREAIVQAEAHGLLGDDILDTGFAFHVKIKEGAGAFVCGEETALIASIEGKRGEPRPRPPFPVISGVWGKPTNVNNVKSYANVPRIILNGADWFRSIGTEGSPGTAIFALTGKVKDSGLIEVPMGITLGEIIFDIGGGIPGGKAFKAVQTGGPLGGCLPTRHLNVQVDFDSLRSAGAVMGSGGMIVVDEDTCMVEFSKFFLQFATAESCGKCVPCRVGGQRMLEVITRISEGRGKLEDLDTLRRLADGMKQGSLCGLGQLTPGPLMSALQYFEEEFRIHILEGRCPAGVCKMLTRARCINACPAEVDIPAFVALIGQGRYAEALEVHREHNPFAAICGRVCPAFCEQKCRRADIGEPLAIRHVKRFMADHEIQQPWTPAHVDAPRSQRVAVVGAGPAGLTAALRLCQQGYPVTIFEKLPVAGGMMAVGIPEYRLPRNILNAEIENIRRAGAEIVTGRELGVEFTVDSLLDVDGFSAVVLAIGAHKSRRVGIPGEDLPGVIHGTDFLREANLGAPPPVEGKRVAIVGGGAVAIDAARMAWRLGATEIHLVYRRTRADMPAWGDEVQAADVEGIHFHFLTNPTRILGEDRVTGLECAEQSLGEFDMSARRRPVPIAGSEFVLDVDVVIPAVGEAPDVDCLQGSAGVSVNRDSTITISADLATSREGVFAAGDAAMGPATVVMAVAQGNKVAVSVDAYLHGHRMVTPRWVGDFRAIPQIFNVDDYAEARRPVMPELSVAERYRSVAEVELGLDEAAARAECRRCLRCDLEWMSTTHPIGASEDALLAGMMED
ncbi:MAG TPA: FAD-dependent oxidoreductase [Armatimonadota bacterium]|jgi:NADH-quinone oxidoreductase subunit F